jgi:hypothetical protein
MPDAGQTLPYGVGFRSLTEETPEPVTLEVRGTLPSWLEPHRAFQVRGRGRRWPRRRAPKRATPSPSTSKVTILQARSRLDLGSHLADIPAEFKGSSNHEPPPCTFLVRYRALRYLSAVLPRLAGTEREAGGSTPDSAMRPRVMFFFALPALAYLSAFGVWRLRRTDVRDPIRTPWRHPR